MITVKQAKDLRYGQLVYFVGHWDQNGEPSKARVSGKVQTWKTRPDDFSVPPKRGLYDTGYLTPRNAASFTLTEPPTRKLSKKPKTERKSRPYYPEHGTR